MSSRRPAVPSERQRRNRIRVLAGALVLVIALLGARATFLGTVRAGELGSAADRQQQLQVEVPAPRGSIVSRDGRVLANDRLVVDVTATPALIQDPADIQQAADALSPILRRKPETLAGLLSGNERYALLKRQVDATDAEKIAEMDLTGIHLTDTFQRHLPRARSGAQLLGLTDIDRAGQSGLELQFDEELQGSPGERLEVHDPAGRPLKVLAETDAKPGATLRLTIDTEIQAKAESILASVVKQRGAKSATAIVMDPRNGKVFAMATVPRFNPNVRTKVPEARTHNRPVTDTFEPGSTFKVVTVAGALEEKAVTPATRFNLPVSYTLFDRTLREAERKEEQTLSVTEILRDSSNIGTVKIAEELGADGVQRWIDRFGFGETTGITYPGEVSGLVLPRDEWSGVSIINIPIGQGIGVTLAQMARAYSAIANGGLLVTPRVVNRVGSTTLKTPERRRIMSRATARKLNKMLVGVVDDDGTGINAQITGYQVAGKTGTANKVNPKTGEYDKRYVASFVGYAPASKPQLLVAVSVDEPRREYYGGAVAAPAFKEIALFALQRLKIAP